MRATPFALTILWLLSVNSGFGVETEIPQIGTYTNWATTWQTLPGGIGTDAHHTGLTTNEELDFVGDTTNPGLYWADNNDYIFFRMRVDADNFTTASGAHLLLIDIVGAGITGIDYGFAWDSKSKNNTTHGLEMQILETNGTTWGDTKMKDIDGLPSEKGVNDINGFDGGVQRKTDGYVRSIDEQSTSNFGNTTFIDFAVSWDYLTTRTADLNIGRIGLAKNQQWNIAVASINNATDHNAFNADIGGGASLTDTVTIIGWSGAITVPEPGSTLMVALTGVLGLLRRRRISLHE